MISTLTTFLIVDPLDGTKEFVQRRGDFTVNIALVEDGVPVRGVVYAPAKGGCSTPRQPAKASRKPGPSIPRWSAPFRRSRAHARQRRAIRRRVEIAPRCGDR
jgi:3'-phosphoadenosine 5'-phosphosulfate (PAPS) 3'-phosphatase